MKELIYIVEDDEGIQEVYEGAFEDVYETKIFSNGADFFALGPSLLYCLQAVGVGAAGRQRLRVGLSKLKIYYDHFDRSGDQRTLPRLDGRHELQCGHQQFAE